ncbi:MAG: 6-pyruvoyl trahydropterin synthase family protein [Phycisphaerales bacterium]
MYELTVTANFSAAHAIRINQREEPVHGHNWHVTAAIVGAELDSNDLLVDFHQVEGWLHDIVAPFHNQHLNTVAPFDRVNPTAERVAEHIARQLAQQLPVHVQLKSLCVTEAPGCCACYLPE